MMKRIVARMLVPAILLTATTALGQETRIVVNQSNPIASLSRDQVARIFLKKMTSWENGQKIQPVDQPEQAAVRETFSETVLDKSVSAVNSYWQRMIFSGGGTPPLVKGGDAEVLAFVKENPGAIGYVSASAEAAGVKLLQLTAK